MNSIHLKVTSNPLRFPPPISVKNMADTKIYEVVATLALFMVGH
jgi:hypothetical protein